MKRMILVLCVALLKMIAAFIPFYLGYCSGIEKATLPMAFVAGILFLCMLKVISWLEEKERKC